MPLVLPSLKGSMLTHAEMEANFSYLETRSADAVTAATEAANSAASALTQVSAFSSQLSNKVDNETIIVALDLKADKSTTYTKTETGSLIDSRISNLIGTAPANLDTLQEIAAALNNDANAVSALTTTIASKASQASVDTLTTAVNAKASTNVANTFTEVQTFGKAIHEKTASVSSSDIDVALASVYTKTVTGNMNFTVSNVPASGTVASFMLELTNGGAFTVGFWGGVKWPGGTVPTLTAAGKDVLGFYTIDGGVTWTGLVLGKDVK